MMWLFLLLPGLCLGDVVLDAVFLISADAFPVGVYRQILSAFGQATVLSVAPDTMTGAEALGAYFPNRTDVFRFQLLHITRVRASVVSSDDANTTRSLAALLPGLCGRLGPMAIAAPPVVPADSFLALFPPITAPVAIGVWLLTVVSCGACWLVTWCCAPKIPVAVVTAAPKSADRAGPCAPPSRDLGPAAVRLVLSCAEPKLPRL